VVPQSSARSRGAARSVNIGRQYHQAAGAASAALALASARFYHRPHDPLDASTCDG
jgi:hypothetical protein